VRRNDPEHQEHGGATVGWRDSDELVVALEAADLERLQVVVDREAMKAPIGA